MDRLWAPWRMAYVSNLPQQVDENTCFICSAWADLKNNADHLVVGRSKSALVMLNRYPYQNGHLLIAPSQHIATMSEASDIAGELWDLVVHAQNAVTEAMHPHAFNIGINQGAAAGAGLAEHLHIHVVPRWRNDVNFISVTGEVRVISQSLEAAYDVIRPYFVKNGLF